MELGELTKRVEKACNDYWKGKTRTEVADYRRLNRVCKENGINTEYLASVLKIRNNRKKNQKRKPSK